MSAPFFESANSSFAPIDPNGNPVNGQSMSTTYDSSQWIDNNNLDPYSMQIMNQKLSQMSIGQTANNLDLNGNHRSPTIHKVITLDNVVQNIHQKLSNLKQLQQECQHGYRDLQQQYGSFTALIHSQLDSLLQELQIEFDQQFKHQMMELNYQRNQLEEILFKIEDRKNTFPIQNGNGKSHQEINGQDFLQLFEPEFVQMVRNILETSILGLEPNIRLPNIDNSTIERALRTIFGSTSVKSHVNQSQQIVNNNNDENHFENNNQHLPVQTQSENFFNSASGSGNIPFATWQPLTSNQQQTKQLIGPQMLENQNFRDNFYFNDDQQHSSSTNSHFQFSNGNSTNDMAAILNQKQAITKSLQPKVRRERICYYLKFGEAGSMEGQFAEPSGVAVNHLNDEIYIADANNHRVQVFDKWGKFKFHFGDGKLKFPNRVALSKNTGEIVVSERPPVHQIQVYQKNGQFVCKFGAKHLRHPRGVAVDHKNRVVVVECKVMRVFIFNLHGVLLHSFDCSEQIQFPNAVAVSRKEEIYISDNRNHCVKVFNFMGEFLRQIGGQGITNYPIGVCLNETADQLLVVDNYNNLNVTVFRLDGQLIGAYESSAKHQQCLDVALFSEQSIVVTSKDLQVYFYRLNIISGNQQQHQSQPQQQQQQQQTSRRITATTNSHQSPSNKNNGIQQRPTHHH